MRFFVASLENMWYHWGTQKEGALDKSPQPNNFTPF
jgi:hypothetical protein